MENEHLWRNLSTTTMTTDFNRAYQQQSFNLQFPASFNHDPASDRVSTININDFRRFSTGTSVRKTFKVMLEMYPTNDNGVNRAWENAKGKAKILYAGFLVK